jgi:hypothetical protein
VEKKWAVALAILMLVILVGALFFSSNTVIVINGQEVGGPLKGILAAGGLVVGLIAFLCGAILLLFVFAGLGVIVLGLFVIAALVLAGVSSPFLLIVLIPLALVWLFVAVARKDEPGRRPAP